MKTLFFVLLLSAFSVVTYAQSNNNQSRKENTNSISKEKYGKPRDKGNNSPSTYDKEKKNDKNNNREPIEKDKNEKSKGKETGKPCIPSHPKPCEKDPHCFPDRVI